MPEPTPTPDLVITADLKQLVERAEAGDTSVLPELRRQLTEVPELWRRYGDLATHAEKTWIAAAAGDNQMLKECLERKLADLQAELGCNGVPPLEQLLIRRIAASWLQTEFMDATAGQLQARGAGASVLKLSTTLLGRAQQRLIQAIKGLALVRTLRPALAPLQVASRITEEKRPAKLPSGGRFAEPPVGVLN